MFEVHKLNQRGLEKAQAIAEAFETCLKTLESICLENDQTTGGHREMAITRTKLQEACFFAKRAMALNHE